MHLSLPIRTLALIGMSGLASAQTTWHVDDDGMADPGPSNPFISDPMEDGSALHPFDRIQEAIDAAASGDTVLVEPGTYFDLATINLSNSAAGPAKALHILGVAGSAATTVDASGFGGRVFISDRNETAATILEGFTIRNGNPGTTANIAGGGLRVLNGSPTLRDLVFEDNTAFLGGGLYLGNSNSLVEDCVFDGNPATHQGGGTYVINGAPVFSNCRFTDNTASYGGGFLIRTTGGGNITVEDCFFQGNSSTVGYAGGLAKFDGGSLNVLRTHFVNNSSVQQGGGMYISNGATIESCIFNGNGSSNGVGGGFSVGDGIGTVVRNTTIVHNTGGGVAEFNSTPLTLENCIVWNNGSYEVGPNVAVTHSNVLGGYAGPNNLDSDPMFRDPLGPDGVLGTLDDDLVPLWSSPCIDAGLTSAALGSHPLDFEGRTRVQDLPEVADTGTALLGRVVDMGAHELQPPCSDVKGRKKLP